MNRSVIAGIVIVVIILAGGGILLANKDSGKHPSDTTDMNNMNMQKGSTTETSQPAATNKVSIENFAFTPAAITIKKGTTVTWTNKDSATHTVTETDGKSGPNSGDLATGKSYTFTFDAPGTYHYNCTIHPNMTGTVTVTE